MGKVSEQELMLPIGKEEMGVRRISLVMTEATRDGETEIQILTNLPSEVDGVKIADFYRHRWIIENRFYEVTQTMNCEPNPLGYPKSALLAFCLALVASNAVALIRATGIKRGSVNQGNLALGSSRSRSFGNVFVSHG